MKTLITTFIILTIAIGGLTATSYVLSKEPLSRVLEIQDCRTIENLYYSWSGRTQTAPTRADNGTIQKGKIVIFSAPYREPINLHLMDSTIFVIQQISSRNLKKTKKC